MMLFTSYHEDKNIMCITKSTILSMIDNEIKERRVRTKRINSSCYQAIVDLERKINNPNGYMEDALWETRSFYNKKRNLAIDSDFQNNMHNSKEDISYSLKQN